MAVQQLNLDINVQKFNNAIAASGKRFENTFKASSINAARSIEKSFADKKVQAGISSAAQSVAQTAAIGFTEIFTFGVVAGISQRLPSLLKSSLPEIGKSISGALSNSKKAISGIFEKAITVDLSKIVKFDHSGYVKTLESYNVTMTNFIKEMLEKYKDKIADIEFKDGGFIITAIGDVSYKEQYSISKEIYDRYMEETRKGVEELRRFLDSPVGIFYQKIQEKTQKISNFLEEKIYTIPKKISNAFKTASDALNYIPNKAKGYFSDFAEIGKASFSALSEYLSEVFKIQKIKDFTKASIMVFKDDFANPFLENIIHPMLKGVQGFLKKFSDGLHENVKVIKKLGSVASTFSSGLLKGLGLVSIAAGGVIALFTGLGLAFKAVFGYLSDAAKAFEPIERSMSSIQRSLKSIGESKSFSKVIQSANNISMLTGTGGEDVLAAQSMMIRRGLGVDKLDAVSRVAVNVMQDPANKVNNLLQASELVLEAMEGSVSAAERLGIKVKNTGDSSADLAARMQEITAGINAIYGGNPQLISATQQFSSAWNSVRETIGSVVKPYTDRIFADFSKIIVGFLESGALEETFDYIAAATETIYNFFIELANDIEMTSKTVFNIFEGIGTMIGGAIDGIIPTAKIAVLTIVQFLAESIEKVLGETLSSKIGIDSKVIAKAKEQAGNQLMQATGAFNAGINQIYSPMATGNPTLNRFRFAGAASFASAMASGSGEISASGKFLAELEEKRKKERDEALKTLAEKAKEMAETNNQNITLSVGIRTQRGGARRAVRRR